MRRLSHYFIVFAIFNIKNIKYCLIRSEIFNKNEFTIYDFTGHKNLKDYDEI